MTWLMPLAVTVAALAVMARLVRTSGTRPDDEAIDLAVYLLATAAALAAWLIWGCFT
jgi:hypothetical protein